MKYVSIKIKKKIGCEDIFLVAFDFYLIFGIIGISLYSKYLYGIPQKIMSITVVFMLLITEINRGVVKLKKREIFLLIISLFLFLSCYMRNPIEIAVMYLLIFSSRNFEFKKIALHAYYISLILLIIIICSSQLGIIRDVIFEGYRHAVGFRYALYGPSLFLNLIMIKFYLEREKISWITLILYAGANTWLLWKCDANLSCGLAFLLIIYAIYEKTIGRYIKKRELSLGVCRFSFIICIVISFGMLYLYSHNAGRWLLIDRIMSGRLQLSVKALSQYPLSLLGHDVEWIGNGVNQFGDIYSGVYYYVDNAYFNVLIESGIVVSLIIWSLYTIVVFKCLKSKEYLLVVCFSILAVYFIFDNLKLKLIYNTFVLLLPLAFMKIRRNDLKLKE